MNGLLLAVVLLYGLLAWLLVHEDGWTPASAFMAALVAAAAAALLARLVVAGCRRVRVRSASGRSGPPGRAGR